MKKKRKEIGKEKNTSSQEELNKLCNSHVTRRTIDKLHMDIYWSSKRYFFSSEVEVSSRCNAFLEFNAKNLKEVYWEEILIREDNNSDERGQQFWWDQMKWRRFSKNKNKK